MVRLKQPKMAMKSTKVIAGLLHFAA